MSSTMSANRKHRTIDLISNNETREGCRCLLFFRMGKLTKIVYNKRNLQ